MCGREHVRVCFCPFLHPSQRGPHVPPTSTSQLPAYIQSSVYDVSSRWGLHHPRTHVSGRHYAGPHRHACDVGTDDEGPNASTDNEGPDGSAHASTDNEGPDGSAHASADGTDIGKMMHEQRGDGVTG